MAIAGEGNPFLVGRRGAVVHGDTVLLPEKRGQLRIDEVKIGLADDVRFRRAEELFEAMIAGQVAAFDILQPDQVGERPDQLALSPLAFDQLRFGGAQRFDLGSQCLCLRENLLLVVLQQRTHPLLGDRQLSDLGDFRGLMHGRFKIQLSDPLAPFGQRFERTGKLTGHSFRKNERQHQRDRETAGEDGKNCEPVGGEIVCRGQSDYPQRLVAQRIGKTLCQPSISLDGKGDGFSFV